MNVFDTLAQKNSPFSIVWLAHLFDKEKEYEMFIANTDNDFVFQNQTYKAETFNYKSNSSSNGFDGGGILTIATVDNCIIDLVESKKEVQLEIIGVIVKGNEKELFAKHKHHYGKPKVERGKATFTFNADDRPSMTFPSLIFSTQNNRGNA